MNKVIEYSKDQRLLIWDRKNTKTMSPDEGIAYEIHTKYAELAKEQEAENKELKANLQWFIDCCENNEVRSGRAYSIFVNLLEKYK